MDVAGCLGIVRSLDVGADLDLEAPDEAVTAALLDFTRAVAHAGERKDAPLAAFAMGIALARTDPGRRVTILRDAASAIDHETGDTVQ